MPLIIKRSWLTYYVIPRRSFSSDYDFAAYYAELVRRREIGLASPSA